MLSFTNTEIAFAGKSDSELYRSYMMYKMVRNKWFVKTGKLLLQTASALHFPVGWIVKSGIFRHFCGGETLEECAATIQFLLKYNIRAMLDFSAEGKEEDSSFENVLREKIKAVNFARGNPGIPFSILKMTGIARFALLEKVSAVYQKTQYLSGGVIAETNNLSDGEKQEWNKVRERLNRLCKANAGAGISLLIDAEETWIQEAIDLLTIEMMAEYNKQRAVVYNTYQLYRTDRLDFLKQNHKDALKGGYILGAKLVRGAYLEKERLRAEERHYPSPVHKTKEDTDRDYDAALRYCAENIQTIFLCNGTHNERSNMFLTEIMEKTSIAKNDTRVYFAQLYGMSDHISFNLAHENYNVAKHVPYGKIREVLPYLIRRAEENTSFSDQSGRELGMLKNEIQRRKNSSR